jgi:hypothetical protein
VVVGDMGVRGARRLSMSAVGWDMSGDEKWL